MGKKTKRNVSLDELCHERDKALGRVVDIYLKDHEEQEEELMKAIDLLTVAHVKATFEQFSGSLSSGDDDAV